MPSAKIQGGGGKYKSKVAADVKGRENQLLLGGKSIPRRGESIPWPPSEINPVVS